MLLTSHRGNAGGHHPVQRAEFPAQAQAPPWPVKPVRMVIGFAPGLIVILLQIDSEMLCACQSDTPQNPSGR